MGGAVARPQWTARLIVVETGMAKIDLLLAGALPLVAQPVIFGAAWVAQAVMADRTREGLAALAPALVTFGVLEAGLALICIMFTVMYQERRERPMALAVSGSWLLGAFLAAMVLGFAP